MRAESRGEHLATAGPSARLGGRTAQDSSLGQGRRSEAQGSLSWVQGGDAWGSGQAGQALEEWTHG